MKLRNSPPCFSLTALSTALMLMCPITLASQVNGANSSATGYFPLVPNVTFGGTGASGALIGSAESLIPLYGSWCRGIFFADVEGQYDNHDAYLISPGVGLRSVLNNQILGAYAFGDYTKTDGNGKYFVLNPGLEWMSLNWDADVNGYFPKTKSKFIQNLGFASNSGNFNFISFSGHTEFDQELLQYGVVGNGIDGEIGYSFPVRNLRGRVYAGGYHYAESKTTVINGGRASDINGGQIGIECPLTNMVALVFSGSDDNVNKVNGAVTLRLSFGSSQNSFICNVRDRLTDPVHRHLGTLNTAAAIPSQKVIQNSGENIPFLRNIWFFLPGTSIATGVTADECTFEHPCTGINQDVVNSIGQQAPNAIFYFAPGQYFPITTPTPTAGTLTLVSGQSWWGREAGYVRPAQGADRAVMNGVLELPGSNVLDSLQVFNDSVESTGIFGANIVGINVLGTSGSVLLNNLNIDARDNFSNGAFSIYAAGNSAISLSNSTLNATVNHDSNNGAENIAMVGDNAFSINNSILNATNVGFGGAFGIFMEGGTQLAINNSIFNTNNTGIGSNGAFGIFVNSGTHQIGISGTTFNTLDDGSNQATSFLLFTNGSNVTFNDTTFNAREINASSTGGANDVLVFSTSIISINNSHLNATNTGGGIGGAFAVKSFGGSPNTSINIDSSILDTNDNGTGGSAGLVLGSGNATMTNSIVNAVENGTGNGGAFGVEVFNGKAIIANSTLNAVDNGANGSSGILAAGLNAQAIANGVTINSQENGAGEANGIAARFNGDVNVSNSSINVISTEAAASVNPATGVHTFQNGTAEVQNTTFNVTANGHDAVGAQSDGASNITILNSIFSNVLSQTGLASGVQNNGTGTIRLTNTNFNINGPGAVFNSGPGVVIVSGGVCTVNGVVVPCS